MKSRELELVVAVAENGVIGRGNEMPWHLSADLRRFKTLTLGKHILMGRKTYESIGKALPGRTNLVLSRSPGFVPADAVVADTFEAAWALAGDRQPLMVIGGAQIYRQCLAQATRIHLTLVHAQIVGGDAFFDGWRSAEWRETSREYHSADARDTYSYSFITLDRQGPAVPEAS